MSTKTKYNLQNIVGCIDNIQSRLLLRENTEVSLLLVTANI